MESSSQKNWIEYCNKELARLKPILAELGFVLDDKQVHIAGERYVIGGQKLVLLGRRKQDNYKVVIKASSRPEGIKEILAERKSREMLQKIHFAYRIFYSPQEIMFRHQDGLAISIIEFIDQKSTFIERPLKEQFFLALKAFEAQEGVHITTYEHNHMISSYFGAWTAEDYLQKFDSYRKDVAGRLADNENLNKLLQKAGNFLEENKKVIDLYTDFLTHWDFVPHNIRIKGNDIYLLDYSSIRFGNKYEGWARFINFMILHNPELEQALVSYVRQNRNELEFLSLKLMRIFRLVELIWYYMGTLDKAEGNLLLLNKKRINLWEDILELILADRPIDYNFIAEYKNARDKLRDDEEKQRQEKLH